MKSSSGIRHLFLSTIVLIGALTSSAWAQSFLAMFDANAENRVFHFYIDEAGGETADVDFSFSPNAGGIAEAQVVTTLNRRDYATLDTPDWNGALDSGYWIAHPMTASGSAFTLTLPVTKTGSYDVRVRYRSSGGNWQWYGGRNPVVNVSDVSTRDLVVYEMQANVMNATGDDHNGRSTFRDMYEDGRMGIQYLKDLGVNCIWLQPFHPIGAKDDCNSGTLGSPYSIKNLFQVAPHLGSQNTRENAMHEFTNFVQAAAAEGISVIFDVIFNHVATDIEIERDPSNPYQLYSNPLTEMRNVRPQWFSRYVGNHPACQTTKPGSDHGNYRWWEPAQNAGEIGPAPADRHDFVWPDAFDLFWGTYPALGNINDTSDGEWVLSNDVKEMVEYYAYFIEYWIEVTGGHTGGFRCDFAQGIPRKAWQYLINRGKSVKPDLYFVSESLDGGSIAYRAWKGGFDAINENQLWAIVDNPNIQTTDLRAVIDSRKTQFGLALILRGTMNHDQGPWLGRKWDALAMHSVFAAVDGTPQMYMGQELGYDSLGQYSKERVEFGRTIANIREYHNINNLWDNRNNFGNDALWHRYKDANLGRARAEVLRTANQYYLDQRNGGPHQKIFSVLKYENLGWDPADQQVVLAFVNLSPQQGQSGTFNLDIPAIWLEPSRLYNVRNLASSNPNQKLWGDGRTGADIKANGIFVGFSGNVSEEGSVAQFLVLEEEGDAPPPGPGDAITSLDGPTHWPENGSIEPGQEIWINIGSAPAGAGDFGGIVYSADGVNWQSRPLNYNEDWSDENMDWWNVNLGSFPGGAQVRYAVQVTDKEGTAHWRNNDGANFVAMVNESGGSGGLWVGNTDSWPRQGEIWPDADLWIDSETFPIGPNQGVTLVYSSSVSGVWQELPMSWHENTDNNSRWHVNLGAFPAGATIQFAVNATNESESVWDNNNGNDFIRTVNTITDGLQWIGNTRHYGYQMIGVLADLYAVTMSEPGRPLLQWTGEASGNYRVHKSADLSTPVDEWAQHGPVVGTSWEDTSATSVTAFYAVESLDASSITTVGVTSETDLAIEIETYPIGKAVGATVVYSTTGQNWLTVPMQHIGTEGNNDIWQANLGAFPHGISVQYAIAVEDTEGDERWDNNGTSNYAVGIRDPNAPDDVPPVLTYAPAVTSTSEPSLEVTLTATDDEDPNPAIYYTTDGSTPSTGSTLYSGPILVTTDLTLRAVAVDAAGNFSAVVVIPVEVNKSSPPPGGDKPYSTNPTLGKRDTMTIDGNPAGWTDDHLIALDMANDDPRSLGGNWTLHEPPIDLTHLWAAWDDDYLYLAWQYVDVTDVIDPANAGSTVNDKIANNDGILQWIVIDTVPGQGATADMWQKKNTWSGPNKPNYQIYLAGSLWQGYISSAQNGVFPVDDGGVNYNTVAAAGINVAKGNTFGGTSLWGVWDADDRHDAGAPTHNFLNEGHNTTRDSFYEMRIPLSYLNVTAAQIESSGIGVMIGGGGESSMDSIPHDETTLDTEGVTDWNSSLEWTDDDVFTVPFARIGK